jgi:hypothetical protein
MHIARDEPHGRVCSRGTMMAEGDRLNSLTAVEVRLLAVPGWFVSVAEVTVKRIAVQVVGIVALGLGYQFFKELLGGALFTFCVLAYLLLLMWLGSYVERNRANGGP